MDTSSTSASTTSWVEDTVRSITTVGVSQNVSTFGQPVTLTASVSGTGDTPTHEVAFMDGDDIITGCDAQPLNGSAQATCTTSSLPAGTHLITAVYMGDVNFDSSYGTLSGGLTVNPSSVVIQLASSSSPTPLSQMATFTATVGVSAVYRPTRRSPTACALTGTVTFNEGGTLLGSAGVDAHCQATYSTSSLAAGTHNIAAVYADDPNYASGTSNPVTMVVSGYSTTTSLISSQNPSTFGQSVTFTASVAAPAGNRPSNGRDVRAPSGTLAPTGTVTFMDGGNVIPGCDSQTSNGSTEFTCATSVLSIGTHTVTANYSGDANFSPSSGTIPGGHVVNPPPIKLYLPLVAR
jgi:hypothetical protein